MAEPRPRPPEPVTPRRPRFLLDEHLSPRVAERLRDLGIDASAVKGTEREGMDDEALLRLAAGEGRILVTYNIGDFAAVLADFSKEGLAAPGIAFVDSRTIPSSDFSGLARALARLARRIESGEVSAVWGVFLTRG
ncbi:MAG: DUF5615 family PIN-like protein [Planctomycetota bacterium]